MTVAPTGVRMGVTTTPTKSSRNLSLPQIGSDLSLLSIHMIPLPYFGTNFLSDFSVSPMKWIPTQELVDVRLPITAHV